jgi:hypothetical protein
MSTRLPFLALSILLFLGPPSIKVAAVSNPALAPVKGAVLMLTAHHHQSPFTVSGRAEGIVDGKRVSRPLALTRGDDETTYGVTRQWSVGQPWVLVFTVNAAAHAEDGVAEALVSIDSQGRMVHVDYPLGKLASGTPWPRRVTQREIDSALAGMSPRH